MDELTRDENTFLRALLRLAMMKRIGDYIGDDGNTYDMDAIAKSCLRKLESMAADQLHADLDKQE